MYPVAVFYTFSGIWGFHTSIDNNFQHCMVAIYNNSNSLFFAWAHFSINLITWISIYFWPVYTNTETSVWWFCTAMLDFCTHFLGFIVLWLIMMLNHSDVLLYMICVTSIYQSHKKWIRRKKDVLNEVTLIIRLLFTDEMITHILNWYSSPRRTAVHCTITTFLIWFIASFKESEYTFC